MGTRYYCRVVPWVDLPVPGTAGVLPLRDYLIDLGVYNSRLEEDGHATYRHGNLRYMHIHTVHYINDT